MKIKLVYFEITKKVMLLRRLINQYVIFLFSCPRLYFNQVSISINNKKIKCLFNKDSFNIFLNASYNIYKSKN